MKSRYLFNEVDGHAGSGVSTKVINGTRYVWLDYWTTSTITRYRVYIWM
jgi:hypothetical protein